MQPYEEIQCELDGQPCREYQQGKIRIFSGFRTRYYVASQPDKIYIFGDNTADRLAQTLATATQAVIRGLPNAYGIDTKHCKGKESSSYFTDAHLPDFIPYFADALATLLSYQAEGKTLVFPEWGIGTWAAKLATTAPQLFAHINSALLDTFWFDNLAHSDDEQYTTYYQKLRTKK